MKIIHCADFHLDSRMNANLDRERAGLRKAELLQTFVRMVEYAYGNDVEIILIAGDLFDTASVSAGTGNTVMDTIRKFGGIRFYYLRGNHDRSHFLWGEDEIPANLKLFDTEWRTYEEAAGRIRITGKELTRDVPQSPESLPTAERACFQIVMLHGQESEGTGRNQAEVINLKEYRNRGIDYLALGHIHGFKLERLDDRGVYCYPGCPEGRGFDECGTKGFVLLDVDEDNRRFTTEFVPFASRTLTAVEADVTGCESTPEMLQRAKTALAAAGCGPTGLVKLVLQGELTVDCEKNPAYLQAALEGGFFFLKVVDDTTLFVDYREYLSEESLKGEFVRLVLADTSLTEEEKPVIIRYGLQALAGEEV